MQLELAIIVGHWIRDHEVLGRWVLIGQDCLIIDDFNTVGHNYSPFNIALYIYRDKVRTAFKFIKFGNGSEYLSAGDPMFFEELEKYLLDCVKNCKREAN